MMGTQPDRIRKMYGPMKDKTVLHALAHRIGQEFPRVGGPRIRNLCAEMVLEVLEEHLRPRERLSHGQVLWMAVNRDEPPKQRQKLLDTRMVPVVLNLSEPQDIDRRIARVSAEQRLTEKARRLCLQAYEQGGLLSNCDLAELLGTNDSRIAHVLVRYEKEHQTIVPRRANLHDVGTGLTHKRIICWKRYAEGKEPEQVARETYHSLEAVDRYLGQYDRVRHCRLEGMTPLQTAEILNCSVALVQEYLQIDQQLQDRATRSEEATSSQSAMPSIPWLDFALIRRQVTLEQLLCHLGFWRRFRQSTSDPSQWRGPCPMHEASTGMGSESKKTKPPFSVNTERNIFQCFEKSCGVTGNVIEFWRLAKNLPLREAAWDLVQTFGLDYAKGPQEPKSEPTQNEDP
jgi:DNA-binding CsgD family transcriptional regulator